MRVRVRALEQADDLFGSLFELGFGFSHCRKLRLCRPMCGKPLAFRHPWFTFFLLRGYASRHAEAQPRSKSKEAQPGKALPRPVQDSYLKKCYERPTN